MKCLKCGGDHDGEIGIILTDKDKEGFQNVKLSENGIKVLFCNGTLKKAFINNFVKEKSHGIWIEIDNQ